MRVLLLVMMWLASSSLNCAFAQDQGEPKPSAGQVVPAPPDQTSRQQRDPRTDREPLKDDDRGMRHDRMMMRHGDSDRIGRDGRDMGTGGPGATMQRDRQTGRDRDIDRGRYSERENRDDDADRDSDNRGYSDEAQARRRVKICVEYDNGDEYCRYRQ
jgi:hypothetical protein